MPEHVHVHVPHELAEPGEATSTRERWLEIAAALMLSLATLGIAWSGYQAAKWSGLQARRYTQASTARSFANRAATLGAQDRTQDLLNFNRWLEVSTEGDTELADLYERRFRDEFRPAFEEWEAGDPLHNEDAIASPLYAKSYKLANVEKADKLNDAGRRPVRAGQGGDRARRRLRVRHRVLRDRAVLRRHLAAVHVVADAPAHHGARHRDPRVRRHPAAQLADALTSGSGREQRATAVER